MKTDPKRFTDQLDPACGWGFVLAGKRWGFDQRGEFVFMSYLTPDKRLTTWCKLPPSWARMTKQTRRVICALYLCDLRRTARIERARKASEN